MQVNPKSETILEDGQYPANIVSIETVDTKYGERLIWKFLVEHGGERMEKVAFTSLSDSERGNLVTWAKAVLGDVSGGFNTEDLHGKPCVVVIEQFEREDGTERNKVTKVKSPKKDQKEFSEADFEDIPF